MAKKDILIIDDDNDLASITQDMLEDYGYTVDRATSISDAYDHITKNTYKLILLDINLPEGTGFEFCTELRKYSTVPIIFISARTSESDRITGLEIGADDYLSKPYSLQELLSRVKANIRRAYGFEKEQECITVVNITIDRTKRKVYRLQQEIQEEIKLSLKEYDLLLYLIENKNKVLKKEKILSDVWGTYAEVELSTVAVHIRWLREKIEEDPAKPKIIKTVWGVGYLLEDKE
ncbi:response regulator transcription factor [Anaeromicropila herbilytica]|uniref:Stage 0 sporulation protein A homolog n=1 Tax=Anaeromicropila herbilytica TaxID=2785025 RepID=A0A7R7EJQ4_9FIRM|nr:response regulator transcription factor [Anaeromicropila herbilytica]BCN29945.1 DNA-binding response regulator [Anaeromicropila herbilytica]